jgi:hypothetical protein
MQVKFRVESMVFFLKNITVCIGIVSHGGGMVYKAIQEKGPWTLAFSTTVDRVHLGSM